MSDATRAFFGSWPEFYDRLMVPLFFEPYARRLVERLKGMRAGHVMEIAAGTGVVTREQMRTLPDSVPITATDLSQPLLDPTSVLNASGGSRLMRSRCLSVTPALTQSCASSGYVLCRQASRLP
jgi:hypothetical protein